MRIIPTSIHGVLDYGLGIILIGLPFVAGVWTGGGWQAWLPAVLGAGAIGYSLITDYELGLVHLIPMPTHLVLDAASGCLLAASPFLFGFSGQIWVPYVVLGALEVGASLMTRTHPGRLPGVATS